MDPTAIEGITPSAELRRDLAGQTVLLAFSRGKDSIAAWLALRDAGVHVVPYHLYLVPGLEWVTESLAYYEDWFGTPILNLPHPSLYRWLANLVFQPPERCSLIEATQIVVPTYANVNAMIREHFQLPADTWVCDGVRAADSPNRRTALASHGPVNEGLRTQKVVWDWRKQHVTDAIRAAGVELPPDYAWFGRSFDGLDRRFLDPIRRHAAADYARILEWFPLADLELHRAAVSATPCQMLPSGPEGRGFRGRARREAERFRLATDSEYWIALSFGAADSAAVFMAALGLTPHGRYLPGPELEAAVATRAGHGRAPRPKWTAVAQQTASRRPVPDPLATMACTGDLAADADVELAALLAALSAAPARPSNVLDSLHHLIAYWPTRAAKDAWLAATGLADLGDKYLDGDAAAGVLGLPHSSAARRHLTRRLRASHLAISRQNNERASHG